MQNQEIIKILEVLEERFGFPKKIFQEYKFLQSKDRIYIISKKLSSIGLNPITQGYLFARINKTIKPSTDMIQVFGKYATKNIIELEREEAKKIIQGLDIELDFLSERKSAVSKEMIYNRNSLTDGYVILRYKNYDLGCGLLKEGRIKNQIPKGKRINVKFL